MTTHATAAGTPRRPRRRARPIHRRRGLTLLEVTLATVLLGLVAMAITSVLTFLSRVQTDDLQRLGAHELANRKILEFLDDKTSIGSPTQAQELNGFRYRWELREEPVRMTVKPSEASVRSSQQLSPERFKKITVRVSLVDERASRTAGYAVPGEEMASLTRIYDPFGILFRNADSRNNKLESPDGLADIVRMFTAGGSPQGTPAPNAAPAPGMPSLGGKKGSK